MIGLGCEPPCPNSQTYLKGASGFYQFKGQNVGSQLSEVHTIFMEIQVSKREKKNKSQPQQPELYIISRFDILHDMINYL